MTPVPPKVDSSEYTVGWIAALPHERAAAQAMLDQKHAPPQQKHANDHNIYSLGSITGPDGEHNVAIASLPFGRYGTTSAATVATQMLSSFPNIKFGLMVGIGGGIPSDDNDIRLGDVVVSKPEGAFGGVRQYDCGKATTHGFEERGQLNSPPQVLLNAMGALVGKHEMEESAIPSLLESMRTQYPKMGSQVKGLGYVYQGENYDRLFEADYAHDISKRDCVDCDPTKVVKREERSDQNPCIHYGTIGSGDQVIKDARKRDSISKNCLCFETEAAGLMNNFPCLVIRGICDYSDSHKNDQWQRYAAATAAAYAKELLQIIDVAEIRSTPSARDVMHELKEIKTMTNAMFQDQKRQGIFGWLTTLNPSSRHLESQRRRVKDTGRWMLEDPKFVQWYSTMVKCRTLCCYGAAGAGKTIISSLVIDRLEEHLAATESNIGLAYVYCDFRDQKEQSIENILGAILKQLVGLLPEIPEAILKAYDRCVSHQKPFSSVDAMDLLRAACAQFSKTYVCLDALDEVGDLRGLLTKLRDSPSSMQIFLTGRQHVQDTVQEYFKEDNIISIKAHEDDIRLFCESEIGGANDLEPNAMDEKLRKAIISKVTESAKGVFLLPTLQIRAVLQATTIRDRYEALKTLPSNLDEAFVGTMSRIEQQPGALVDKAARILAWIHLAERPLTVGELLCALSIQDGDKSFDPRGIPIRKSLLNCCQGLALIDHETSTVRLVHYSLEEYLSRQDKIFGHTKVEWHSKIARTCLTFLQFPPERAEAATKESGETITLLSYAATKWGDHLRRADDLGDALSELAAEYLYNGLANNSDHLRLLYEEMYAWDCEDSMLNGVLRTHIAAFFGISGTMAHLISTDQTNLDSKDEYSQTPLWWAAREGHKAVVTLLLDTGKVDPNSKDTWDRTPLSQAAEEGHDAVVKLLLNTSKMDPNSKDEYGQTPLSFAAEEGHDSVVKLLLDTGKVDPNSKDTESQTPLLWAAMYGHDAVVKLLLGTSKVDPNSKDTDGRTPLSWAVRYGHEAVIRLLLDTGKVDPNSKDTWDRTPLSLAAENGHEASVRLLLDTGKVDPNSKDTEGQTPLSLAAENGHDAVVKLLEPFSSDSI